MSLVKLVIAGALFLLAETDLRSLELSDPNTVVILRK